MPWSAHLSEQVIIVHITSLTLETSLPFYWLLIGALFPDYFLFAKAWLYFKDSRNGRTSLLGAGHSILISLAIASLVFVLTREKWFAYAFFTGAVSHILSDLTDSKGCALLYPFSSRRLSLNLWTYSADKGLAGDLRFFCSNWKAMTVELVPGLVALFIILGWFGILHF